MKSSTLDCFMFHMQTSVVFIFSKSRLFTENHRIQGCVPFRSSYPAYEMSATVHGVAFFQHLRTVDWTFVVRQWLC